MIVYKYQTINKNSLSGLIQRKIWCSKPSDLNDPFEVNITEFNDISQNYVRTQVDLIGIISFTEVNDNLLMWAHYGDNHKGLCLGFDIEDSFLHKVKYRDTFPTIDLNNENGENGFIQLLLTKSSDWSYERELRMITADTNCLNPFPGRLVEVCFGARTPNSDKEVIKSILKTEDLIYKYASLHGVEYKVVFNS